MNEIIQLGDIDHRINEIMTNNDPDVEEIQRLVDTREQILLSLYQQAQKNDAFVQSSEWQDAIQRTQCLVEQMEVTTSNLGRSLRKYQHGNRSVQQYKKFL